MIKPLKKSLFALPLAFAMFLPGCDSGVEPEPNKPCSVSLSANPVSGISPLEVNINANASDPDGSQDISSFSLKDGNKTITTSFPFNGTEEYNSSTTLTARCNSSGGGDSKNMYIEVLEPVINQTAVLENQINLNYSLNVQNVLLPDTLKVFKNQEDFAKRTITESSYQETFSGLEKGTYDFKFKNNTETEEIPNYIPEADFNDLEKSFKEDSELVWDLEQKLKNADNNPEDNPVPLVSVTSLDNKTQTSLEGYEARLSATEGETGESLVEITYGSAEGGFNSDTLNILVEEGAKYVFNPFIQPNQANLNWYGSGDVNNDNNRDMSDVQRLVDIIESNFSDANDNRLLDRADVNGDEVVDNNDKQMLEERIDGTRTYLPGEWGQLETKEEREDWLEKMLAIDKTDEREYIPGEFICGDFAAQTRLNFHGFPELGFDESTGLTDNGRFNIPTYYVTLGFHAINTTITGDNIRNFTDYYFSEPQNDLPVQIGHWNMPEGSEVTIKYNFINENEIQGKFIDGFPILKYKILNGNPELIWMAEESLNLRIIGQRSASGG